MRALLFAAMRDAELAALGAQFATSDILAAVPAFSGALHAGYPRLRAAQRAELIGYDPGINALIVAEAVKLRALAAQFEDRANDGSAARAARRNAARVAVSDGVRLRNRVFSALATVLPADHPERDALDALKGTADTGTALKRGLGHAARLLRAHRDGAAREARDALDVFGLDDALVARLESAGKRAEAASNAAEVATPEGRVTQRELDRQDGVVLHLMRIAYRAFRDAHARDESILRPPVSPAIARAFDSAAGEAEREGVPGEQQGGNGAGNGGASRPAGPPA